jgi:exopolysaccharide biosynthesis polyprenyl glycosylphosphotransferase
MSSYFFNPLQRRSLALCLGDIVLILASFLVSMAIRILVYEGGELQEIAGRFNYMYVVLVGIHLLYFYIFGMYDSTANTSRIQILITSSIAVLASLLTIAILFYLLNVKNVGRVIFFLHFVVLLALILAWRTAFSWFARKAKRKLLIVGDEATQGYITHAYLESLRKEFAEITYFHGNGNGRASILGSIETHLNGYDPSRFSVLFTKFNELPPDIADALVDLQIKGVEVNGLTQYSKKYLGRIPVDDTDLSTLMHLSKTVSNTTHRVKRIIDFIVSLFALILLSPVLLLTAAFIKLDSRGPVFYRQKRMGQHGKEYECLKLRTMVTGADKNGPQWVKEGGDSRVTRVGKVLRSTRLDEVPQFINVLRGEMSIVGPRPTRKYIEDEYVKEVQYYKLRHLVKPGITGWAQVNQGNPRTKEGIKQRLEYDLFYIVNMSIFLDLFIQLKTARTLISKIGKGAAV